MKEVVEIAYGTSAHGIKGAVNLKTIHSMAEELEKGMELFLRPSNEKSSLQSGGQFFTLKKITFGHKVMAEFDGVHSRNDIEAMIPFVVCVPRSEDHDDFYEEDLIGFKVIDHISKKIIGEVKNIYSNNAQTILEIDGDVELDIPYVDQFVKVIRWEEKEIEVLGPEVI